MLNSFHPRAGIMTVHRNTYMYDTPSQVCVTISGCEGWGTATNVVWSRIPSLAVVAFFKDNDCAGEVIFTTDPSQSAGSHPFNIGPIGKVIKSLMVLEYSEHPVGGIVNECFPALDKLLESANSTNCSDSNSSYAEEVPTVTILSSLEGNISSNWLDPLSDGISSADSM